MHVGENRKVPPEFPATTAFPSASVWDAPEALLVFDQLSIPFLFLRLVTLSILFLDIFFERKVERFFAYERRGFERGLRRRELAQPELFLAAG